MASYVDSLPTRKRLKHHIWSQVHKAFSMVSAQDIPAERLDEARNFIAAYVIETPLERDMQPVTFTRPKPPGQPNIHGIERNGKAMHRLLQELMTWGTQNLPDTDVRTSFCDAVHEVMDLHVTCWPHINESLLRIDLAATMLRRWQARSGHVNSQW